MTITQLPISYPRNDREAHALIVVYVVIMCGWMAALIVQAVRENDGGLLLALAKYLAARLAARVKGQG